MGRFVILKHLNITSYDTTDKDSFFIDDAMRMDYVSILSSSNFSVGEPKNSSEETGKCMW